MDIHDVVRRIVLQNAIEHEGKANVGSVIGHVLGQHPELRQNIQEIQSLSNKFVNEINILTIDEQKSEIKKIGGYLKEEKREKIKSLPDIPEVAGKKVVVRIAPNPDGAIHIGNARPAVLSDEYKKKYKGKFILRFDDTDPKIKVPEKKFYKICRDGLKWLGIRWNTEIVASKRLKIYYRYAEKLVKIGAAYVCICKPEEWRAMRNKSIECPCRNLNIKEHVLRWKMMLNVNTKKGKRYSEGQAVLRIKTDINHSNPAVRDWPAMRIVDKPNHPFSKARLWPLYNLASSLDDHLTGVNIILRGQEHATNETKQAYIYNYFKWPLPKVIILGRFLFPDFVLSKSLTKQGIKEGGFSGWNDPKLGTLIALKRRGFSPQAIRNFILEIGVKSNDAVVSFENLAAANKKIVDKTANRYFFVKDPVQIRIKYSPRRVKLPIHPDKKGKNRTLHVKDSLIIDREDYENEKEVRLIGLYNIIMRNKKSCSVINEDLKYAKTKHLKKIHWLPNDKKQIIRSDIIMPDKTVHGYCERNILKEKQYNVIQFERFGFVRIEKKIKNKIVGVFGHK